MAHSTRTPINPRTALIAAREQLGLSRQKVARILGIGEHYAKMIENGRQDPSVALMERWLDLLNSTDLNLFRTPQVRARKKHVKRFTADSRRDQSAA